MTAKAPHQPSPLTSIAAARLSARLGRLATVIAVAGTLAACGGAGDGSGGATAAVSSGSGGVPSFTVDPSWPRTMPNDWIMGSITAVFVDAQDHVWVTHLPETLTPEEISAVQDPPMGLCCRPAPVVVEFDADGNVVQGWGDPQTQDVSDFPRNAHGLFVDHNDNVWVGTYRHHRVMKFTRDGQLLMQIGEYDVTGGSNDTALLGGPAGIWIDPGTNEVFIADGYRNRRVVVFDAETGEYKRHWGAYGEMPVDEYEYDFGSAGHEASPPEEFSTVHGLIGSNDGLIYVADRRGNRIQVFQQDGTFVTEKIIEPRTLASGSAFVITLSPDPEQRWLYLADGTNHKVWILDRSTLEVVGDFGRGGRQLGQFLRPHGMGIDSQGNLYVGEASTGRRIQKFSVSGG
jgi:sugar lactone lactonase YvrE